jgi:chromosome partitioning protein
MNKWLRRLGVGGRRDKVESDVERLAQGGEFHVKQPDEAEAQASISSAEPPIDAISDPADATTDEVWTPDRDSALAPDEAARPDEDVTASAASKSSETADLDTPGPESASAVEADAPPAATLADLPEDGAAGSDSDADVTSRGYADGTLDVHAQPVSAENAAERATATAPGQGIESTEAGSVIEQHDTETADDTASAPDAVSGDEGVSPDEAPTNIQEEESPITQEDAADVEQDEDSPIARELEDLTARRKALEEAEVHLTGRTRVLTISNQKGGVGKTTTTVNLAAALAERGARVLVIDLDPQGNASTALGVPHTSDIPSVYDVLIDEFPLADIIQVSPESPNLLCAPSTIHLAGAEIELVSQVAREHRLRVAVDDYLTNNPDRLDFILIDCPPSLGLLTINAFTAAGELLIPIQCEYYALEGLSQLLGTVQMIQKHLNPRLQLSTILLTMYDGRTRLAQQVADEVREHFPSQVLDTIIPRSVRVSEAPSFGQSVLAYDGQSAGAIAYREAAVEMIRRDSASNERGA